MNFVHFKKSSVFASLGIAVFGLYPHTLISETPSRALNVTPAAPLTILYSGITKLDTKDALLLKIDSEDTDEIHSVCNDERILIDQQNGYSTLQWKPGENCKVPLISYKGKNYILPLSQKNISIDTISDISTETLKNTLSITTLLNTDTKLSSIKTRKIIRNIHSVLEARNTPFLFPIE